MPSRISRLRKQAAEKQCNLCYYCNLPMWSHSPTELPYVSANTIYRLRCTAEHLRAKQDGGSDNRRNIVAACIYCNQTRHKAKHVRTPDEYQKQVRKLMARGKWHPKELQQLRSR